MNFDNYIYMTICEESLDLFKNTHFSTYSNYCKTFHLSMVNDDLNVREKNDLLYLLDILNLLYGLNDKDSFKYINNFFSSDGVRDFELYVLKIKSCFPLAFN